MISRYNLKLDQGYCYFKCRDCKTIFLAPLPKKSKLDQIYDTPDYYFSWEKEQKENSRIRFRDDQKKARVFLNKTKKEQLGGKILDIGCAMGHFLYWMAPYFSELHGVEYSDFIVKNKVSSNIQMVTSLFNQFPDDYFDVITAWEVLEHATNPFDIMQEVYRILKPGGKILLTIPNGQSLTLAFLKEKWYQAVAPEHLTFFSKQAIKSRLNTIGFKNIHINCSSRHYLCPSIGFYPLIYGLLNKHQNKTIIKEADLQRNNEVKNIQYKSLIYSCYFLCAKILSFPINYFGMGDSLCIIAGKGEAG